LKRIIVSGLICTFGFISPVTMAENLMDIYKLAQQQDPQIALAEDTLMAAMEARPQSLAGILPSIIFSADASRNKQKTVYPDFPNFDKESAFDNSGYSLSLSQPLYRAANFAQIDQADASIAQAEVEYLAAKQDLLIRTANGYFEVLAAKDNLTFARAEQEAIGQQLEQVKQRFEVGLNAITDVLDAQARYDLVTAQVIEAEFSLDDKRESLREITNQYPSKLAPLKTKTPLVAPEPANISKWNEKALEQNLELLVSRYAAKVTAQEIKRQKAGHLPTLDLVMSARNRDSGGSFSSNSKDSSIGLQLELPLYLGGAVSSAVNQAQHNHQASLRAVEQAKRSAEAVTRTAYRGVVANITRVKAFKQAVTSNQSALDATEEGYEVGTRTSVDVLNARRELFLAQRDYAQSRYEYTMLTLELKRAIGELAPEDLMLVNEWLEPVD